MFPPGLPGLALLLLRASTAIALLAECYSRQRDMPGWMQAAAILVSLALSLGYLTPIMAAMCLVLHTLIWSGLGIGNAAVATTICLDAIALSLLGPGAYSIDYYRFGRRQVVLPPR
jgi:putative oxidoreductase